jgi:hypothetical protein
VSKIVEVRDVLSVRFAVILGQNNFGKVMVFLWNATLVMYDV